MSWCNECGVSLLSTFVPIHRPHCHNSKRVTRATSSAGEAGATKVIENECPVPFDVDDTLLLWDTAREARVNESVREARAGEVQITDPHTKQVMTLTVHNPHVELLKRQHARGKFVIVWSQSGFAWAKAVVDALGLNEYVGLIMTKPGTYVDDLPVSEWMKDRIYISPDSNWGQTK